MRRPVNLNLIHQLVKVTKYNSNWPYHTDEPKLLLPSDTVQEYDNFKEFNFSLIKQITPEGLSMFKNCSWMKNI